MSLLIALILQVGPFTTPQARPVSPLPIEMQQRKVRPPASSPAAASPASAALPAPATGQLRECLDAAASSPAAALVNAQSWLDRSGDRNHAAPLHCLGVANANLGLWSDAEAAFLAARDASSATDRKARAAYGAMAGNAALADGGQERALGLLDLARGDALAAGETALTGGIELDRARALVALKRDAEAAEALTAARQADPASPDAWLLSATLSRRQNDLATAQTQIETAAGLAPLDPAIGLEAGVIAVLLGHDDAARRSWNSVLAAAPESDQAATARTYLAQLGPVPAAATAPNP